MFFYNEYTQNKEFGAGGFVLKTVVRYLPVLLYLRDFISAINTSTLSGVNGCEVLLVVFIVITGIIITKPTIQRESMTASFRHKDVVAQVMAFVFSTGYLGMLLYVIFNQDL